MDTASGGRYAWCKGWSPDCSRKELLLGVLGLLVMTLTCVLIFPDINFRVKVPFSCHAAESLAI
jgi:hypothetical protein